jgi:hypothetical protein
MPGPNVVSRVRGAAFEEPQAPARVAVVWWGVAVDGSSFVLSIATVLATATGSRVGASVRWVVVPHPDTANTYSELKAIACPNVDMCVAVGD